MRLRTSAVGALAAMSALGCNGTAFAQVAGNSTGVRTGAQSRSSPGPQTGTTGQITIRGIGLTIVGGEVEPRGAVSVDGVCRSRSLLDGRRRRNGASGEMS